MDGHLARKIRYSNLTLGFLFILRPLLFFEMLYLFTQHIHAMHFNKTFTKYLLIAFYVPGIMLDWKLRSE